MGMKGAGARFVYRAVVVKTWHGPGTVVPERRPAFFQSRLTLKRHPTCAGRLVQSTPVILSCSRQVSFFESGNSYVDQLVVSYN